MFNPFIISLLEKLKEKKIKVVINLLVVGTKTGGLKCVSGVYSRLDGITNSARILPFTKLPDELRRKDGRDEEVQKKIIADFGRDVKKYRNLIKRVSSQVLEVLTWTRFIDETEIQHINWAFMGVWGRYRSLMTAFDVAASLKEIFQEHSIAFEMEILLFRNKRDPAEIVYAYSSSPKD